MKKLWQLFWSFAKIGVCTFGGGYAMLPFIQAEIVEKKKWATDAEIMDYYAIGQCTPGVIAVNVGTFVGHKTAGFWGGVFATLGVVFPSVVIILLIAAFISNFADLEIVAHAFAGIRACVCVFIFNAVRKLWSSAVKDKWTLMIFLAVAVGATVFDISAVLFVIVAAVLGILIKNWGAKKA
jgi:chromate transporter